MAEDCIVCLGSLRTQQHEESDEPSSPRSEASTPRHHNTTRISGKAATDTERIAHLLPCKHDLHDECLRPWVERANSCPICRATFNEVEVKDYIDGPTVTSYAVQDKQQQAEVETVPLHDESLFEEDGLCIICGTINDEHELMYCDGCDRAVHIFCASDDDEPADIYYCHDCCHRLDAGGVLPMAGGPEHSNTRSRRSNETRRISRRHQRQPNSDWARVWQTVWDRLNLDLDFPFDEEPAEARRTPAQRRDFAAWDRRLRVANHQGAASRFRAAAPVLLHREEQPPPETQEERSAWNAFDRAREATDEQPVRRKRKATESPASPREPENGQSRKLKRPRTQAMRAAAGETQATRPLPESSAQAQTRQPGFLASLLQEVERRGAASDPTSPTTAAPDDQTSAGPMSSPDWSPITSNHNSPRGGSVTPPPLLLPRPAVTPISSTIRPPLSPPIAFSPFSPTDEPGMRSNRIPRGRASRQQSPRRDQSPLSPSRLSYSTKAEVQRMVKSALGSRYRDQEITKDQYTDINRDVSRLLYEQIDDANDLADYDSRNRLQKLASDEVQKAVEALSS